MTNSSETILALDVGSRRIGVASADTASSLPKPLQTLNVDENIFERIAELVDEHNVSKLVLGLPRNLEGNSTEQTKLVEAFAGQLRQKITIPVYLTDEAVTSVRAEEELKARGQPYDKSEIDSLAAVYILEDFLNAHQKVS